jgi:hypothetical protein
MHDDPENDLRTKVNKLVARLPAKVTYSLLSEIEGMDAKPAARAQLVRQYVIEHLNRQRTSRAQRLFTTLFEPFLIDDDALYHADTVAPGMVQRADVGALWEMLSRDAFSVLAAEAQERLDEMASRETIDRAIRHPLALSLRERMRVSAVGHLDSLLGNRKTLDETLAALSRNRPRRSWLLSAHLDKVPLIEAGTVQTMRDILAHCDGATRMVVAALESFPDGGPHAQERDGLQSEAWADLWADRLLRATDEVRERYRNAETIARLLPLSVLNVKRGYAVVALSIRQSGVDPGKGNAVTAGLTAHFLGTLRALTATLTAVLRLNERMPGSAIRPSAKEKARIEALTERLAELTDAAIASGLMGDRRSEPTFRNGWGVAGKIIGGRVAGVAMERTGQAAAARHQPVPDHADVVWLNRFLWRWQDLTHGIGFETYDLLKWRDTLLEEMRANVERAMKFEVGEPLDERMAHLLRIDSLCTVFGQRVSDWIPTTSHSMVRLLTHRLERGGPSSSEEAEIIGSLTAAIREEVKKSRYWKSDELMGLVELADRTEMGQD